MLHVKMLVMLPNYVYVCNSLYHSEEGRGRIVYKFSKLELNFYFYKFIFQFMQRIACKFLKKSNHFIRKPIMKKRKVMAEFIMCTDHTLGKRRRYKLFTLNLD